MIIQGDCLDEIKKIKSNSIDLLITSPPYNLGIEYNGYEDDKSLKQYLVFMQELFTEVYRVMVSGGRVCVNIPPDIGALKNNSKVSLDSIYYLLLRKCGFYFRTKIVWNKNTITSRTAWGSFNSPSNPNILPPFEYIIVAYKDTPKKEGKETDLTKEEFISWTNGLWNIAPESKKKVGHPAPYPVELCVRLIKMFSYIGDTVLDPFMGSGTTGVACKQLNREFIGIEQSAEYCELADRRINNES